jgi:hypothetical protein
MKNGLLSGATAIMVLTAPLYAHAQGIPDGIAHGASVGNNTADRLARLSAAQLAASWAVLKVHSVHSKRRIQSSHLPRCTIALT